MVWVSIIPMHKSLFSLWIYKGMHACPLMTFLKKKSTNYPKSGSNM
jgi:hypothetical protein